jgi:hypothetical protein
MRTVLGPIVFLLIFSVGHIGIAFAQAEGEEVVLVQGNPPLTQLTVGKSIVLLEWALDIKLTAEHKSKIKQALIRAWQTNDREDIKGALEIVEIYEKVAKLSEGERNQVRGALQEVILKSIGAKPDDELARLLLSAYESSHSTNPRVTTPSTNSNSSTKNKFRVGVDGFSGIYRMLRPRALNINSNVSESGYYIEHITFLPSGHVYWALPPEGLLYFDPAVAQRAHPDDWGTYEIKNGEIHILRGPSKSRYLITRTGERLNNPPSLGKGTFRPVPSADGLKIEGNYRRHQTEPTITFTTDGTFRDGGVFRYFGTLERPDGTVYQDDGIGGSGTYIIEQNTLELRYSDGRIKRHSFIVFPENLSHKPALDSFILRSEERMERY